MVLGIIMSHLYRHPKLISIRISLVASIAFNCRIVILTGGDSSVYLQHLQDGRGHSSKPVSELGNFSEWNPSRDFWKYMNIGLDAGVELEQDTYSFTDRKRVNFEIDLNTHTCQNSIVSYLYIWFNVVPTWFVPKIPRLSREPDPVGDRF